MESESPTMPVSGTPCQQQSGQQTSDKVGATLICFANASVDLFNMGHITAAEHCAKAAMNGTMGMNRPDDEQLAAMLDIFGYLASKYESGGYTTKADELRREVASIRQNVLGNEHSDALNGQSLAIASLVQTHGVDEALRLATAEVRSILNELGIQHSLALETMDVLVDAVRKRLRHSLFCLKVPELRRLPLSEEAKLTRQDTLSRLQNKPASSKLQQYFKRLRKGSELASWNLETFVDGLRWFAHLTGPGRSEYYQHEISGFHLPKSFTSLWNEDEKNAHIPITLVDTEFDQQCTPQWSSTLTRSGRTITQCDGGSRSEALNGTLRGPSPIDCGIFCSVALCFASRYVFGDKLFDRVFQTPLSFTQEWLDSGTLVDYFYDTPQAAFDPQSAITLETIYNDEKYLDKHPTGTARLQNIIAFGDECIAFIPGGKTILSRTELQERLRQDYNKPRDAADLERLALFDLHPCGRYRDLDYEARTFGELAAEASKVADHTICKAEWDDAHAERKSRGVKRILDFEKLRLAFVEACAQQHNSSPSKLPHEQK